MEKRHRDAFLSTVALVFLVTLVASGYLARITDGIKRIDIIKGILPLISALTLMLNSTLGVQISTDVMLNILIFIGILIVVTVILRIFGVKSAQSSENSWSGQHRYQQTQYYSPPPRHL